MRRFPPEPPKPQEIVDLEKPDDEGIDLKWNAMMDKSDTAARMEEATQRLKEWQDKLEAFNKKVPQPEEKPVEIIQEDLQKKTEDKEIVVDNSIDGFDPAEVEGYEEFNKNYEKPNEEDQIEKFKQREKEEQEALEEYARKAREEDEPSISEQIEEVMEPERIKPDFTEVLEPEKAVKAKNETVGILGTVLVKDKKVVTPPKPQEPELPNPAEMSDFDRTGMLNKLHQQHGKYEDISDEELKMERDQSNRAQYLADVSLTKEEAAKQGPITESRMAFFQDMIDDILRGNTTFENVPEENRKIIAQIMDPEIDNPEIITKGSALKPEGEDGIEKTTAQGLKEKFMIEPKTEERPMTDEELDELLKGFEEDKPKGKTKMIIKNGQRIFVPVEDKTYVQNEEQNEQTLWQKTKELDLPEPEKNEIILPELKNTVDDVPEIAESINIEQSIPQEKFDGYKSLIV